MNGLRRFPEFSPLVRFRQPVFGFCQPVLRFLFGKRSALTRHDFQLLELLYWSHERHQWLAQSNRRVISAN